MQWSIDLWGAKGRGQLFFEVMDGLSDTRAHASNGKVTIPVVYTKFWGKGRVFYNSLGHTYEVFESFPAAKEMMRRGFLWATR